MRGASHRLIGVCGAVSAAFSGMPAFAVGFYMGACAPDYLELSFKKPVAEGNKVWHYQRLIPHRTLTHWAPIWLLIIWLATKMPLQFPQHHQFVTQAAPYLQLAMIGYCLSALVHIICDSFTPMGVPLWQPFGRRYSYQLVRGKLSELVGILSVSGALSFLIIKAAGS